MNQDIVRKLNVHVGWQESLVFAIKPRTRLLDTLIDCNTLNQLPVRGATRQINLTRAA